MVEATFLSEESVFDVAQALLTAGLRVEERGELAASREGLDVANPPPRGGAWATRAPLSRAAAARTPRRSMREAGITVVENLSEIGEAVAKSRRPLAA